MSSTLSHEDYTVAWVCALPLEMTAAKAMLDEIHSPLSQPPTDHNAYTLGRLNGHNVVIASLPLGVYGTTSAATVLAYMRPTFPSLRFGLMVGIGGGVPNADIRLGDVVVSTPTLTSGGVIQYDYGKTIRDGCFQRTGSLNKPPHLLLTATAQMRSNYLMGERPIEGIISNTLERHQGMNEQFSRPNRDWLFLPEYGHQDGDTNCLACHQSQLVNRPPRETNEPHVHYGLIASGNQVMKDAQIRDRIAKELGILCFEMEAAGLVDQIPCLVIRGICDYCDSHKHKKWQGYAALTAAAYAKILLSIVPVTHREHYDPMVTKSPVWMVPFGSNPRFVGRCHEITAIEELISQQDGPRKIAITGLGGIGKTQVALQLAYRIRDRGADCSVFWIPSISYESVEQAYLGITRVLCLQDVKPAEAKERVKTYLSQKEAGKWLLIFDNADDIDMWFKASNTALSHFLPQSDQGHIIFTTRNQRLAMKLASSNVIPVPELDKETAAEILEKSLIQKNLLHDSNTTAAILQQLAFLPLAIIQAAAYINENSIGLSDYLDLLQEQEPDVIKLLSEDFEDEGRYAITGQNPIATTWLISFRQIQQLDQLATDYLSFMACVNPRNIPQSFLPPAASKKKKTEALGILRAYSFISSRSRAGDNSFNLHRLVHLATRNWMRTNGLFALWTQKTADRFNEVFPDDDHTNRKQWREYLPHVLFLMENSEFHDQREQYEMLLERVGNCLYSDGRYNEAEALYVDMMKIRQTKKGDAHLSTLASMSRLALTYQYQGRWKEAEELGVQVLETCKQVQGPNHPDTLAIMSNLALTYSDQGRWKEAKELGIQVLEIYKQVLGPDHPNTLTSLSNLTSIYRYQGRWKEAEELQLQVLETRKQVLGPNHPDTLISMHNLARTWKSLGKDKDALLLMAECVQLRDKILGPHHPYSISSTTTLTDWQKMESSEPNLHESLVKRAITKIVRYRLPFRPMTKIQWKHRL